VALYVTVSGGRSDVALYVTVSRGRSDVALYVTVSGGRSDVALYVTVSDGRSDVALCHKMLYEWFPGSKLTALRSPGGGGAEVCRLQPDPRTRPFNEAGLRPQCAR
jgi:hypothetical protein